jgi:hypothetical protein
LEEKVGDSDEDDDNNDEEGNVFDMLLRRTVDPGRSELIKSLDKQKKLSSAESDSDMTDEDDDNEEYSEDDLIDSEDEEEQCTPKDTISETEAESAANEMKDSKSTISVVSDNG